MKYLKHSLAAMIVSALFVCSPAMHADEWNKKTVITIDKPVQFPNVVLPAGTYVFKLLNSDSNRNIVQIFNEDETKLITTILALNNYRLEPTGKTALSFWEVPAGQTPAARAWFYPGDLYGQEFAYPKGRAAEMASYTKTAVPTSEAKSADDMNKMPVTATTENGQSSDLDKEAYTAKSEPAPAPPPPPAAEPAPQPQVADNTPPPPEPQAAPEPTPAPQELPHTASQVPLIGLIGLLSLGGFLAIRRPARVRQ